MTLAEKFKKLEPTPTGLPCGVAKLMETMPKEDRTALTEVMFGLLQTGKRISNSKIYETLTEEGYNIAPSSIAQHRRRQCRCFVGAAARAKDTK